MGTVNSRNVLIVEPNEHLREEIFNFLLSAGYENTEATDNLPTALDKIRQSKYDIVVVNAGDSLAAGRQSATDLAGLSFTTRIIFMIDAEDQQSWDQIAAQPVKVQFLIKTDFARNLLYLLEENSQP